MRTLGTVVRGIRAPIFRAGDDAVAITAETVLNALKAMENMEKAVHLINPEAIEPIQKLKTGYLGSRNPRLHSDETLVALSISASQNPPFP